MRLALPVALGVLVAGVVLLALVLGGGFDGRRAVLPGPPAITVTAPAPTPGAAVALHPAAVASGPRSTAAQRIDLTRFGGRQIRHVPARWVAGFYPLYAIASRTFGINWLLLASIHQQETSFSTAGDTYRGLNFAGCCGGPMQFNVTNGPVTTWDRVSDAYRYAVRPAAYPHATAIHPSIYDDFDAMLAAGRLLQANGAGSLLDFGAWQAAYDYYGHDPTGVTYADQVVARAIGWSQHGFCINCALDRRLFTAVHAAYGGPVLAALRPAHHHQQRR